MVKTLIIYASMSGNTEDIAKLIGNSLVENAIEVTYKEIEYCSIEELLQYDRILVGSYTWGDGDLPYEAEDFYDELEGADLTGKKIGCFGSGDHSYPKFCEAVALFNDRCMSTGASVYSEMLKIEGSPETEEDINECIQFAAAFAGWCALEERVKTNVS
ncbi:flavodoxin [Metabacillus idriensis]|uniref:flavodoxin n=1 Tax=Metabacillus idriensis TaxID=324768 RepID=UPI001748B3FB|nr:flavodoxin [Metabacillus idriensis]